MTIEAIIARYGLLAVAVGAGVEGETAVATGGLLAHQHLLPLGGVVAAGALGSFLADQLFFHMGRSYRDHPRVQRLRASPLFARALQLIERHPTGFVFAFRFLYGMRTISPMAIGTTAIPFARFAALNAAAAILWSILITAAGYAFGHGIELAFGRLRHVEHLALAVAGLAALLLALAWIIRRRVRTRL